MAHRIQTSEGISCSSCGATLAPSAELCKACGQPFEGDAPGVNCPQCRRAVDARERACPACGAAIPSVESAPGSGILEEFGERRAADTPTGPPAPATQSEPQFLAELESIWKLSEPLAQVVGARRKRLEEMDRLIAGARARMRELENAASPAEIREREELKKQVKDALLERDEVLKIEHGITEIERIYRNIIATQQKELRSKEEALRARLEGFRRELGLREAERMALADKEQALQTRERELEARERGLEAQGELEGVSREEWLAAQREVQETLIKLRGSEQKVGLVPTAVAVRDLRMRMSELEEAFEKAVEENTSLTRELEALRSLEGEVREVLKVLDDLLTKLPDEEVRRFARSDAFRRYDELMKRLGQ